MLIFIASSTPWVKFLMYQIYLSIAAAIGDNTVYLYRTNKQFQQLLKEAKMHNHPLGQALLIKQLQHGKHMHVPKGSVSTLPCMKN